MQDVERPGTVGERVVGLPPPPAVEWREPGPRDLLFARLLNVFGLVSPVANLGMVQVSRPDLRWAGVVAGVLMWLVGGIAKAADVTWLMRTAFGVHYGMVVLGLLHPRWPEAVLRVWTRFGELLGKVMSVPIFSLMYFLAVTPVALVMRALGKDPLRRKAPPEASYWHARKTLPRERFHRQF